MVLHFCFCFFTVGWFRIPFFFTAGWFGITVLKPQEGSGAALPGLTQSYLRTDGLGTRAEAVASSRREKKERERETFKSC